MEILQGIDYSIIRMPENLSAEAVEDVIEDFCQSAKAGGHKSEFLLAMDKIPQLHRASLIFIHKLFEKMSTAGCTLSIAGLQDAVENALRFHHVDEKVPLYKTIIDFERQRELDFDFKEPRIDPEIPSPQPIQDHYIHKYNILILDPSIACRNNQKHVLGNFPVDNLVEAKDIPEALKRLRTVPFPIDLVLVDFEALGQVAEEFVRNVHALPLCKTSKIIATGADGFSPDLIKTVLSFGVDSALAKNFSKDDLLKFLGRG